MNFLLFFMKVGNHNRKTVASSFFLRKFLFLLKPPKNPFFQAFAYALAYIKRKSSNRSCSCMSSKYSVNNLNYHQITVISQTAAQQEHALLLINNKWSPLFTRANLNRRLPSLFWQSVYSCEFEQEISFSVLTVYNPNQVFQDCIRARQCSTYRKPKTGLFIFLTICKSFKARMYILV